MVANWLSSRIGFGRQQDADVILTRRVVTVTANEVLTLPSQTWAIRVVSGGAWLSDLRSNIVLECGTRLVFPADQPSTTVTAAGRTPLVLEIHQVSLQ